MIIIRGATCTENKAETIGKSVTKLVELIAFNNKLDCNKVIGIFFTATEDLDAEYPAKAVRLSGKYPNAQCMCMQEMKVANSLSHCLRVAVMYDGQLSNVKHCYIDGAECLRPDLKGD